DYFCQVWDSTNKYVLF
nr:immunoglobulin light chain junction region [Macaca mulatta]MOV73675.1 immunoglobulin light chain junction region [Macaca mulatta]MOV73922.1 immunoglobulin light chain junction region [Macaca mulatta]MOV74012.1 immunoglobulin light chain junction region [Macaca mulatta]